MFNVLEINVQNLIKYDRQDFLFNTALFDKKAIIQKLTIN